MQICLDMHSFNSAIELLTGVTSFLADRALKVRLLRVPQRLTRLYSTRT